MPDIAQSEVDQLGAFKHLAGKYGGTVAGVENKIAKLEEDNRDLRSENKTLKDAQPKDGQVVVSKQDADDLAAYRALNPKPTDLKTALDAGTQAQNDLAIRALRDDAVKFAKAAGLHDETVDTLTAIPALQGAKFEVRKGKVKDAKGQEVDGEIAYLTLAGENQTAMKFDDAKEKVPALKGLRVAESKGSEGSAARLFVPQGGTETRTSEEPKQETDPLNAAIEANRKRASGGSPLRPARQA